jgi:hypothetical protein
MGWLLMGLAFLFAVGSEYAIFDYQMHGGRLPWDTPHNRSRHGPDATRAQPPIGKAMNRLPTP